MEKCQKCLKPICNQKWSTYEIVAVCQCVAEPAGCVIFLDFDGVIRVAVDGGWIAADQAEFCRGRMKMLGEICRSTGAALVVSSDWRHLENLEEIKGYLSPYLTPHLHEDWRTPICGSRWKEVARWLRDHDEVDRYAILEDFAPHFEGCDQEMQSRVVLCTNRYGLVPELAGRVTQLLSRNVDVANHT